MSTKQINIRLPQVIIDDLNQLAEMYGSQAKAIIVAVTNLKKEIEMKQQTLAALETITQAGCNEDQKMDVADRALALLRLLPPETQQEIAKQEFLRFKEFIEKRTNT